MYMNKTHLLLAAIIHFFGQHVSTCEQHDFRKILYWYFDSKTSYDLVRGKELTVPESCQIQQLFALVRHGTRYASTDDMHGMEKLLAITKNVGEIEHNMTEEDINTIRNWKIDAKDFTDKDLSEQGIRDMETLSSRVKVAFSDIFEDEFNPDIHKVLTSHETRAQKSGFYFLQNAFENKIPFTRFEELPMYDKADTTLSYDDLRTDKISKAEKKRRKETGTEIETEMTKFRHSDIMLKTRQNITKRLGLKTVLTDDNVRAMYESCRHNRATFPDTLPTWCLVFSKEDIQIIEYGNDMNWYWKFGYGNANCFRLGCPLLKRLYLSFENAANRKGPSLVIYFGHRENQFVAITMLGLFKDKDDLRADNMEDMENRLWRTSLINPFASNMIAAFYTCDNGDDIVSFFVNEKLVNFELEDESICTLCPWKKVKEKFENILATKTCMAVASDVKEP